MVINVFDNKNPSTPQVSIKYKDRNGNNYKENWSNQDLYIELKSTDYSINGITGSGIDKYSISTDKIKWIDLSDNNFLVNTEGSTKYYAKSKDIAGHESEVNEFDIKIDKTNPEIPNYTIESGEKDTKDWYTSDNVKIKVFSNDPCISNECSGVKNIIYKINTLTKDNKTTTTDEQKVANNGIITINNNGINTITLYTIDNANNKSSEKTIIIKKDTPTNELYTNISINNNKVSSYLWKGDTYMRLMSHIHSGDIYKSGGCHTTPYTTTDNVCNIGTWTCTKANYSDSEYKSACSSGCYNNSHGCHTGSCECCSEQNVTRYALGCGKEEIAGEVFLRTSIVNQRTRLKLITNGVGTLSNIN